MSDPIKNELGTCPGCGCDIAQARTFFTTGPLEGQMQTITGWLEDVHRAVFITVTGSQIHLTMCGQCIKGIDSGILRNLWDFVLNGMVMESSQWYREAVGVQPLDAKQAAYQKDLILRERSNALVGLYCTHKV